MQRKYAGMKAAMIKAQNADKFELVGEYNHALECYQAAVELLLPLLEGKVILKIQSSEVNYSVFVTAVTIKEEKQLLKSEVSNTFGVYIYIMYCVLIQ